MRPLEDQVDVRVQALRESVDAAATRMLDGSLGPLERHVAAHEVQILCRVMDLFGANPAV